MKMNSVFKFFVINIILSFSLQSFSQGIKVKKMEMIVSDLSASINQRIDNEGIPCGLVKVLISNGEMKYEGKVVGEVDNKMNEYWVYLPKGTRELVIKHPYLLPVNVRFSDYGIEMIESKTTYRLLINETPLDIEKNGLVIKIKPQSAILKIDDYEIDKRNDGCYKIFLEKGEHVCKVSATGYRSAVEIIKKNKGFQTFDVNLESLMGEISITSPISDAEILIDDEVVGKGSYKGNLPAGDYIVKIRKQGYEAASRTVVLKEKEEKQIIFPELKRSVKSFKIQTWPTECFQRKVFVDGFLIGSDSILEQQLTTGKHSIRIEITGCNVVEQDLVVTDSMEEIVSYHLTPINSDYNKAYNKDVNSYILLGRKLYKEHEQAERTYWFDMACKYTNNINKQQILSNWSHSQYDWQDLIDFYIKKEDKQKIKKVLDKFSEWNVDAKSFLADNYFNIQCYDKAIEWYKKDYELASQAVPSLSDNYCHIAQCFFCMGDYDNAIIYGKKAENTYRGYVTSKEVLGDSYYKKGDVKMAIQWYKKALQCYRDGSYHGINKFISYLRDIDLYDEVVNSR